MNEKEIKKMTKIVEQKSSQLADLIGDLVKGVDRNTYVNILVQTFGCLLAWTIRDEKEAELFLKAIKKTILEFIYQKEKMAKK